MRRSLLKNGKRSKEAWLCSQEKEMERDMGEQGKQKEKENGGVDAACAWAEQANPSERLFKSTVYK